MENVVREGRERRTAEVVIETSSLALNARLEVAFNYRLSQRHQVRLLKVFPRDEQNVEGKGRDGFGCYVMAGGL